jgi:nucleotidyltransferase/DNA polymerase involved in DNA repair
MKAYLAVSKQVVEILGRFTDLVEPVSIDEAFLDVTGSRRLFGSPQEIAAQIQGLVRSEFGLSCSIGIGPTRLLAKLAAELDKPGGVTTLSKEDVHGRLRALPVRKLFGIGPATEECLRSLGLITVGRLENRLGGLALGVLLALVLVWLVTASLLLVPHSLLAFSATVSHSETAHLLRALTPRWG